MIQKNTHAVNLHTWCCSNTLPSSIYNEYIHIPGKIQPYARRTCPDVCRKYTTKPHMIRLLLSLKEHPTETNTPVNKHPTEYTSVTPYTLSTCCSHLHNTDPFCNGPVKNSLLLHVLAVHTPQGPGGPCGDRSPHTQDPCAMRKIMFGIVHAHYNTCRHEKLSVHSGISTCIQ